MVRSEQQGFSFLWLVLLFGFLTGVELPADTIRIGGDRSDYETIAEGVAAARDGDTVLIAPGRFNVGATINLKGKAIHLMGSGPWKTSITWSGPANGNVFEISGAEAAQASIESLCFNGINGRCLFVEEAGLRVDDCWFVEVRFTGDSIFDANGSAITASSSQLHVAHSVFLGCRTNRQHGGAIYLKTDIDDPGFNTIRNSFFIDNKISSDISETPGHALNTMGGAVYVSGNIEIEQCSFIENATPGQGGAIALGRHRSAFIRQCEFIDNRADEGGAVYLGVAPLEASVISANRFDGCVATRGGAIGNRSSHPIRLGGLWIVGNELNANQASSRGGGMSLTGAPVLVSNQFLGNSSGWKGGGLSLQNPREKYTLPETALLLSCEFTSNRAPIGGALMVDTYGSVEKPEANHIRVEHCHFGSNSGSQMGGVLSAGENASVFFRNCQFDNNESPMGDVFFNPEGCLVSAAGCDFGLNGTNAIGTRWFNGPGNRFAEWSSPTRVAWSGARNGLTGDGSPTYWPPVGFQRESPRVLTSLPYELDALAFLPDGDILFSLQKPGPIDGLQSGPDGNWVDDSDVVRFRPDGFGGRFGGTMEFYLDGSDVGLSTVGENIDALAVDEEGRLYMSIAGGGNLPGVGRVKNRSILRLTTSVLGATSSGTWEQLIDGRDIGLNRASEDIKGLDLVPPAEGAKLSFLISVKGNLQVPGSEGWGAEPGIVRFDASRIGPDQAAEGLWTVFDWERPGIFSPSDSIEYFSLVD